MATNKYFNRTRHTGEQDLFESNVVEIIQMNGIDVYYIKREMLEIDPVLREPKRSVFETAYPIEAYFPDTGNYDGEQNFLSKFGFRINQTTELLIAKKRWRELGTDLVRPRTGDLIYVGNTEEPYASFTNTLFEINNVWYFNPDWQFGAHFTYRLVCETFTNSYQEFNTALKAVDGVQADNAAEVAEGVNNAIFTEKQSLVKFDTKNPFGESS